MRINRMIVLGLVATCLLASCNKKNPDDNVPEDGFVATIEQNGGGSNGRTHINPDNWAYGNSVGVLWTKDDLIKVANGNGATLTYQLTEGENEKRGVFYTGEPHQDFFQPNYVAIYPAENAAGTANTISGTTATFNLPGTQSYKENSFAEKCQPMVAYSTTQTLQFKNVLGCICFPLVGDGITLTSVVLTSNKDSDKLWGTCTTTISTSGGAPTSTMSGGSNSITLDCGTVTLDPETPKYFCIIVPPGTLASGFTVAMYNGSYKIYERPTNKDARIRRSVISETSNITVESAPAPVFTEKEFSVASNRTVYFSPGNLQYIGSASTPYWKFADNQWDVLGTTTGQNSDNQNVDRDLFGWGTSGWSGGGTYNYYYMPYSTSNSSGTAYNWYGYGPDVENQASSGKDLTGSYANADWGVYNSTSPRSISGGEGKSWRTLTKDEWTYLFNTRNASTVNGTAKARYAKAMVNSVQGVILFPDDYTHPSGVTQPTGINQTGNTGWNGNDYSASDFGKMADAGAVFLPAAGSRIGTSVSGADSNDNGYYWSTTANSTYTIYGFVSDNAYCLSFASTTCTPSSSAERCRGCSVRLVHQ